MFVWKKIQFSRCICYQIFDQKCMVNECKAICDILPRHVLVLCSCLFAMWNMCFGCWIIHMNWILLFDGIIIHHLMKFINTVNFRDFKSTTFVHTTDFMETLFIDWSTLLADVLGCAIVEFVWDCGHRLDVVCCQSIHWNGNILVGSNNSSSISTRLLTASAGFVLVVLPLIVSTSGSNAFAAKVMSSVVPLLFLIRFIWTIAFRSSNDGMPGVRYNALAFSALSYCHGIKKPKCSSTVLTN